MTPQSFGFRGILGRLKNLVSGGDWLTTPARAPAWPSSVFIRHLDGGSCNDCELEIAALSNPFYDFERFGFRLVASPRHADILLVTGPFTRSMRAAALEAFLAMPEPRRVVTVGDGFTFADSAGSTDEGIFGGSYAVIPLPEELEEARVAHVPGDPPSPQQILDALLKLES